MNSTDYNGNKLLIFAGFYKRHIKYFILDMVCALFMAGIDLVFPMASRYALNNLLPSNEYSFFFILIGSLVAMYLIRSVFSYIVTYWGHLLGVRIEADMRETLFSHLQRLSFKFYDNHRTGQLMSRVTNDLFDITELAHHGPEDLFISAITLIGAVCILFPINWQLALVLLLLLPVTLGYTVLQRRRMGRAAKGVKEKMAGINADIESSISGARVSKAFTNEDFELHKFERGNERFKDAKKEYYGAMAVFHSGMEFFTNSFNVVVIAVGGYSIMRGGMDAVDLLTFTLYVSAFLQPIRKLTQFVEQYTSGMAGFNRFIEIMRIVPEIEDAPDAVDIGEVKGDITFGDVSFAYNDRQSVLNNINLEIKAGKTVAIVGPSGGGKTTLCHLIPRFYETTEGVIAIDGKDIKAVTLESLRKNIGIVSQDVFLFSGSVRENIRYGRIDATDEEIYAAARAAEIYDDVMDMPGDFDAEVGERGIMLSGGQKQRISIARIFLKNPPILILDEATSALDTVTEQRIQASFEKLSQNRTALVIAHRLSTIQNADEIIFLDEDGLRERGSHRELLARGGEYARLHKTQFGE